MWAPKAWVLGLIIFEAFSSAQYTYWVDESCRRNTGRQLRFERALRGALDMARRGYERLDDPWDHYQHIYFNILFKVSVGTQPTTDIVKGILGPQLNGIASLQPVPNGDREQSNIRFYCDNDVRDPNGQSRWKPFMMSNEWFDEDNEIPTIDGGCQSEPTTLSGITYSPPDNWISARDQPDMRSTITVCDLQLDSPDYLDSFENIPTTRDIQGLIYPNYFHWDNQLPGEIDAFRAMTAFTVLHELCHALPHHREDVYIPGTNPPEQAYHWSNLVDLPHDEAIKNVNCYVYFAVLATLLDRKFRLTHEYPDWAKVGIVKWDPSLPDRMNKRKRGCGDFPDECGGQNCSDMIGPTPTPSGWICPTARS